MDKIKNLWEKHKKIIIILLLLLLLLLLVFTKGFGLFKSGGTISRIGKYNLEEMDDLDAEGVFKEGNSITTFGKVSDLDNDYVFTLVTEQRTLSVYFSDLETGNIRVSVEGISNDDYVAVKGVWNESYLAIMAEEITKLDTQEVENYLASKIPTLEIEILDYTENINHTCETIKVDLRLTNTGKLPIERAEMFKTDDSKGSLYGYAFFHILNDIPQIAENYDETDGILKVWGVKEFDVINPGQSVEVTYYAGGLVTESLYRDEFNDDGSNRRAGVGGEPNILGNKEKGEHSLAFAWGQYIYKDEDGWVKESYVEPKIQFKTEPITIKLLEDSCDLSNPTNIFWVEPL